MEPARPIGEASGGGALSREWGYILLRTLALQGGLFVLLMIWVVYAVRHPSPVPFEPEHSRRFPVLIWDVAADRARVVTLEDQAILLEKGYPFELTLDDARLLKVRSQLKAMGQAVRDGTWEGGVLPGKSAEDWVPEQGCWAFSLLVEGSPPGRQKVRFDCWPDDDIWRFSVYEIDAGKLVPTHYFGTRDGPAGAMLTLLAIPTSLVGGLLLSLLWSLIGRLRRTGSP